MKKIKYLAILIVVLTACWLVAQPPPIAPLILRFLDLTDVDETTYTGEAGKFIKVNAGETALEFGTGGGVEDDAYGAGWNGDTTNAPSQNAVYDQLHTYDTDDDGDIDVVDGGVGGGDVTGVGPGALAAGDAWTDGYVTAGTTLLIWEGTTDDGNEFSVEVPADPGADIVITMPTSTNTLAGTNSPTFTGTTKAEQLELTGSNITYLNITDDIETAVAAATAGDTIVLAAGTYTIVDDIDIAQSINIIGQGRYGTIISTITDNKNVFHITASNVGIYNMGISVEASGTTSILVDGTAGAVLTNVFVEGISIIHTSHAGVQYGIHYIDASGVVKACLLALTSIDEAVTGIYAENEATAEVTTLMRCLDCVVTSAGGTTPVTAFTCQDDGAAEDCVMEMYYCSTYVTETAACASGGVYTTGGANAKVTAEFCALKAQDYDAYNNAGTLTLRNALLFSNTTSGTITVQGSSQFQAVIADSFDGKGAVDMDYGSDDITDHTFTTDDCTLIIDGGITVSTGDVITLGITQWNSADEIDGTKIKDADYGDIDVSAGGAWTLDTDSVADNEIDYSNVTFADFDYETNWRMWHSNGAGDVTEITLGADGTFLESNGVAAAPAFRVLADADIPDAHSHAADAIDAITEIAAALKTGADATLITGTAGVNGNLSMWNVDGDLVDAAVTAAALAAIDTEAELEALIEVADCQGDLDADRIAGDTVDDDDLDVAAGGTGVSTLTDGGILIGNAAGDIVALAVAANGEIPIGDGATDPVLATITGTANEVTVTNGAGSITLSLPNDAGTDISADLEEEAHAAEHAVSGVDSVYPADPGFDGILIWDDNPGTLEFGAIGAGLNYDGATLTAAGGGTAYDDIADPDAAGSISFDVAETGTYTSAASGWPGILIEDSNADIDALTTLMSLGYPGDDTAEGDTNFLFLHMYDAYNTLYTFTGSAFAAYRPIVGYYPNPANGGGDAITASFVTGIMDDAGDIARGFYSCLTSADHSAGHVYGYDASLSSADAQATETAYHVGSGWDNAFDGGDLPIINVGTFGQAGDTINMSAAAAIMPKRTSNDDKHYLFNIWYPNLIYDRDTQVCIEPNLPAAITITEVTVTCDADPASELDWDLKWADAFIGLAGATLIVAIDTTNGTTDVDAGWNDNTIAAGKCIYVEFAADPDANITQVCVKIRYDYD